jgi:hypothetical protein
MSYDLDTFVNVTAKQTGRKIVFEDSVDLTQDDLFQALPAQFADNFEYDAVNEQADPVFVYERNGKPIAFYDCELLVGYIVG